MQYFFRYESKTDVTAATTVGERHLLLRGKTNLQPKPQDLQGVW